MSSWIAELDCPQCGASVSLDVGDRVFVCGHCKTSLLLQSDGPLCYLLPPSPEFADKPLINIPYWRIRGLYFNPDLEKLDVLSGLLDFSIPADPVLPEFSSLGIRPQAARLDISTFVNNPVPLSKDVEKAESIAFNRLSLKSDDFVINYFVADEPLIIYAPHFLLEEEGQFYLKEAYPDGKRLKITQKGYEFFNRIVARGRVALDLNFKPLMCPNCAGELSPNRNSRILLCSKCYSAWLVGSGSFKKIECEFLGEVEEGRRLFPFWEIEFEGVELGVTTREELIKMVISYKQVPEEWKSQKPRLYVPAFKIAPNVFLRIAKAISLYCDEKTHKDELKGRAPVESEPARLSLAEAMNAIKPVICSMTPMKRKIISSIKDIRLDFLGARLVYVPFIKKRNEWTHEPTGQVLNAVNVRQVAES